MYIQNTDALFLSKARLRHKEVTSSKQLQGPTPLQAALTRISSHYTGDLCITYQLRIYTTQMSCHCPSFRCQLTSHSWYLRANGHTSKQLLITIDNNSFSLFLSFNSLAHLQDLKKDENDVKSTKFQYFCNTVFTCGSTTSMTS